MKKHGIQCGAQRQNYTKVTSKERSGQGNFVYSLIYIFTITVVISSLIGEQINDSVG